MTWSGKILSDTGRVLIPPMDLDGGVVNSAAIPKLPNAQLVICVFDPLYKTRTLGHSLALSKNTHDTPSFRVTRAIYTEVKINGVTKFVSPVTIHDTNLDTGFFNKNPFPQDFSGINVDVRVIEDTFEPDMMPVFGSNLSIPANTVQPWRRDILVAFSIGDGTGVVEAMRNGVQRIAFRSKEMTQITKSGDVAEKYEDTVSGDIQVQVWGG